MEHWLTVWRELRTNLINLPRCAKHSAYPHVRSTVQKVINDITSVDEDGIYLRSHRTSNDRYIREATFKAWWNHLNANGSASLDPEDPNNPEPWHSRIVGAILADGLPNRIRVESSNTIELR